MNMFDLPGSGSSMEGDAYDSYLKQQAAQLAPVAPQNPGMEMGGTPQPIAPFGSATGPTSVSPATTQGGTPGIPQVPPSMAAPPAPAPIPLPPSRPTSFGNAGHGFNNFQANVGAAAQPLSTPPAAVAPQSTNQMMGLPTGGHSTNQHNGLANMLKAFGITGGLGGLLGNIGHGIGQIGSGVGNGITGAINSLTGQPAQSPQTQALWNQAGGPTPDYSMDTSGAGGSSGNPFAGLFGSQ